MSWLSKTLEKMHHDDVQEKLALQNNLYSAWDNILSTATSENEILTRLNNALKVVEGLKMQAANSNTPYMQAVNPKVCKVVAVYHCKHRLDFLLNAIYCGACAGKLCTDEILWCAIVNCVNRQSVSELCMAFYTVVMLPTNKEKTRLK
jgi:hypothetical protein